MLHMHGGKSQISNSAHLCKTTMFMSGTLKVKKGKKWRLYSQNKPSTQSKMCPIVTSSRALCFWGKCRLCISIDGANREVNDKNFSPTSSSDKVSYLPSPFHITLTTPVYTSCYLHWPPPLSKKSKTKYKYNNFIW